jgi:hypothetical protein
MKTIKKTNHSKTTDELIHAALKSHFLFAEQTSKEGVFKTPNFPVCVSETKSDDDILKIQIHSYEGRSTFFVSAIYAG